LRNFIDNRQLDAYWIPYYLTFASLESGAAPTATIYRERIWKRALAVRWEYPVHEQLTIDVTTARIANVEGLAIEHHPAKDDRAGIGRNLKILEGEYHRRKSAHIAYYLARDLVKADRWDEAIPILAQQVQEYSPYDNNIYSAALLLGEYYLYERDGGFNRGIQTESIDIAEGYIRIALKADAAQAEPHVFLGDIYTATGRPQEAIREYRTAMTRKYGSGGFQIRAYYEAIPATRLAMVLQVVGELEQALWFNKIARSYTPESKQLLAQREELIECLHQSVKTSSPTESSEG